MSTVPGMGSGPQLEPIDPADLSLVAWQLGREPRGVVEVAHRCPCGAPDVVRTRPRLPDGTPFPTTFYATCPRLTAAISTLESTGAMATMEQRLRAEATLAQRYRAAHEDYLARRAELGEVPEIDGVSAGGMPERVKCLHALAAHSLALGPDTNPFGDETVRSIGPWWNKNPCSRMSEPAYAAVPGADRMGDLS